jgi:chaperone modulatory protein CbpM
VTIDLTEVVWLEEGEECTLGELAVRSRLAPGEIMELVECGALAVSKSSVGEPRFPGHALPVARTAARLRDDFEVDLRGVALALVLLRRIDALERQLRTLTPRAP